jgi:hypothetical protein
LKRKVNAKPVSRSAFKRVILPWAVGLIRWSSDYTEGQTHLTERRAEPKEEGRIVEMMDKENE